MRRRCQSRLLIAACAVCAQIARGGDGELSPMGVLAALRVVKAVVMRSGSPRAAAAALFQQVGTLRVHGAAPVLCIGRLS